MDPDCREAKSAREDLSGLRRHAATIHPTQLGRKSTGCNAPPGRSNYLSENVERGLSARTVRYTHAVLRSAMRQALQWRLLLENPVDGVKIPQQPKGEMRSLTVEQARTFLKAALATPHGPVLAVALTTGMRPSEYLGLKWQRHRLDTANCQRSPERSETRWEMVFLRYKAFAKPSADQIATLDCCASS